MPATLYVPRQAVYDSPNTVGLPDTSTHCVQLYDLLLLLDDLLEEEDREDCEDDTLLLLLLEDDPPP